MDLLICGIDPGTTVGYALLDLEGNILLIASKKSFSLGNLIAKVIEYGRVVIVGCDVKKVPKFVEKFAAELSCSIVHPSENLKIEEKRDIIGDIKVKNKHERDALASAIIAYNRICKILKRIDEVLAKEGKSCYKKEVRELILKKKVNGIKNALKLIEKFK